MEDIQFIVNFEQVNAAWVLCHQKVIFALMLNTYFLPMLGQFDIPIDNLYTLN